MQTTTFPRSHGRGASIIPHIVVAKDREIRHRQGVQYRTSTLVLLPLRIVRDVSENKNEPNRLRCAFTLCNL